MNVKLINHQMCSTALSETMSPKVVEMIYRDNTLNKMKKLPPPLIKEDFSRNCFCSAETVKWALLSWWLARDKILD